MSWNITISEILVNIFNYFKEELWFIYICNQWENVILEYLWKPISVKNKTWMYIKIPFLNTIKKIDIRKKIIYIHAHSFKDSNDKWIFKFNTSIDATIEYRIKNPLIIYYIEDIETFIKNNVHMFLKDYSSKELIELQKQLDINFNEEKIEIQDIHWFSKFFINVFNFIGILKINELYLKDKKSSLLIEKVVLSSYDNLISHRATE